MRHHLRAGRGMYCWELQGIDMHCSLNGYAEFNGWNCSRTIHWWLIAVCNDVISYLELFGYYLLVVFAPVPGQLAVVRIRTRHKSPALGSYCEETQHKTPASSSYCPGSKLANKCECVTLTRLKPRGFWFGRNRTVTPFGSSNTLGCHEVFQYLLYHDMIDAWRFQFWECFYDVVCNFQYDQHSMSFDEMTLEIMPKSQIYNSDSMNIAQILNRSMSSEWASKTVKFTHRLCHDTIRTQQLYLSEKARLSRGEFSGGNWPKSNFPEFWCGTTHCNDLVLVTTQTGKHC